MHANRSRIDEEYRENGSKQGVFLMETYARSFIIVTEMGFVVFMVCHLNVSNQLFMSMSTLEWCTVSEDLRLCNTFKMYMKSSAE